MPAAPGGRCHCRTRTPAAKRPMPQLYISSTAAPITRSTAVCRSHRPASARRGPAARWLRTCRRCLRGLTSARCSSSRSLSTTTLLHHCRTNQSASRPMSSAPGLAVGGEYPLFLSMLDGISGTPGGQILARSRQRTREETGESRPESQRRVVSSAPRGPDFPRTPSPERAQARSRRLQS
jgi:hypothetical protein